MVEQCAKCNWCGKNECALSFLEDDKRCPGFSKKESDESAD